jgi:hypothetical protein
MIDGAEAPPRVGSSVYGPMHTSQRTMQQHTLDGEEPIEVLGDEHAGPMSTGKARGAADGDE